jgi:hypothetical protein
MHALRIAWIFHLKLERNASVQALSRFRAEQVWPAGG